MDLFGVLGEGLRGDVCLCSVNSMPNLKLGLWLFLKVFFEHVCGTKSRVKLKTLVILF